MAEKTRTRQGGQALFLTLVDVQLCEDSLWALNIHFFAAVTDLNMFLDNHMLKKPNKPHAT